VQGLLEVEWPPLLLTTKAAGEVWTVKPEGSHSMTASEEQLVFRGLRVRMGAHTGNDCSISRHPVTGAQRLHSVPPAWSAKGLQSVLLAGSLERCIGHRRALY
jgi:hypothetical protein